MKDKEKVDGNAFFVREKLRWFLIFMLISAFQLLSRSQIVLILIVDFGYYCMVMKELCEKRIFIKWWYKLKTITQETAILIYLLALSIFSFNDNSTFRDSKFSEILEYVVFGAVGLAILSEVVVMISGVVEGIINSIRECKKKKVEKKKKMEIER